MKKIYKSLSLLSLFLSGLNFCANAQTTFNIPGNYTYTVPAGITSVKVDLLGASGGFAGPAATTGPTTAGLGGRTQATLAVVPGATLNIYVGGVGSDGSASGASGGFNGGGNAALYASTSTCGGGGGGASDIRIGGTTLANRKVIAAGGGGAGHSTMCPTADQPGGDGGGTVGASATTCDATLLAFPWAYTSITHSGGGTSAAGGVGAKIMVSTFTPGTNGGPGVGGNNLAGGGPGGGGGGGLYGGGGGCFMGGGGGSSYADGSIATGVIHSPGVNSGSGSVTICPVPNVGSIIGSSALCETATSLFSNTGDPGGVWASSNSAVASVTTTGVVTGVAGGTAVITYYLSNACGLSVATKAVAVSAIPVAISGPSNECVGSSITLVEPALGGVWTSSSTAVATVGSLTGVVNGLAYGTTTITYSNGCGADVTAVVNVDTLPSPIHGLLTACTSNTTLLDDPTPGGVWTSNPISIASVTVAAGKGLVTGFAPGTAVISYTLPTSCMVTTTVSIILATTPVTGSDTTCIGAANPFTVPPAAGGGVWSSGNVAIAKVGSASGVVTGVSIGITTITYTVGSACRLLKTVTVNPLAPIVGNDSVCVGTVSYLTNIVGGGAWTSASVTVAPIVMGTGAVTGLVTGSSTITYQLSSGCRAFDTVYVVANPAPITGVARACQFASTVLADPTPGGRWASLNPGVATIGATTGTVSGIFGDTTTMTYTIAPGCQVHTVVTIDPLPSAIIGKDTLCPGVKDTLHNATPGGTWSSLTSAVALVDSNGVDTTITGGVATLKYAMISTGCFTTKNIFVKPPPVPHIVFYGGDGTFYCIDSFPSYQWYDSIQGLIPGATSPSLAALHDTYYWVVVTNDKGCKGPSALYHFNTIVLGTGMPDSKEIKVYPNPANGFVFIESSVTVRAVVSGMDGRMALDKTGAKELDISGLANGTYMLEIFDSSGQRLATRKLIKE